MKLDFEDYGVKVAISTDTSLNLTRDTLLEAVSDLYDKLLGERCKVVASALNTEKKIQCIKKVREYTGLGLKEAKETVEKLQHGGMLKYVVLVDDVPKIQATEIWNELVDLGFAAHVEDI